jgi:NAD(P)-dependent dehydrogenase (short-subunit alcohol dehydrogenase family)
LAAAYAKSGVRVVGINPGLTETGRVKEGMQATARAANISLEQAMAESLASLRMGRMARPEEIANAVLFLASPCASYITGTTLAMDGAQTPVI